MAKDPAFLFYPGDWMGGTVLLSRHQKGCYIDLLMAQFNNGPLSLEQIKILLGTDQATWTVLQAKFKRDSNGNYYNEKLATEIEKRQLFSQSRSKNKLGKTIKKNKSYDITYENHMTHHMENENENENENEKKRGRGVGKGKTKIPKIEVQKSVHLTEDENFEVKSIFGVAYNWALAKLSNYKLSKGVDYKSDYNALIGWVYEEFLKQKNNILNGSTQNISKLERDLAKAAELVKADPLNFRGGNRESGT